MKQIPDSIRIWVTKALIGEIYPSIRAVAIAFSPDHRLTIRYYLDREPCEFDYESVAGVATLVAADTSSDIQISEIIEECQYSNSPQGLLDTLEAVVYARREY